MYHGEGPKNFVALFRAAERDGALLLFIDEADSLLSRRLTSVNQGSEQAINSMRSQLLVCLENFRGVVVFATNLIENHDPAFETRVRSIQFILPDRECRKKIRLAHLPALLLPLNREVSVDELADMEEFCGKEIRNSVAEAALQAAAAGQADVTRRDFLDAVDRVKKSRFARPGTQARAASRDLGAPSSAAPSTLHAPETATGSPVWYPCWAQDGAVETAGSCDATNRR